MIFAETYTISGVWVVLFLVGLTVGCLELGWLAGRWRQNKEALILRWDEEEEEYWDVYEGKGDISQWMVIVFPTGEAYMYYRGMDVERNHDDPNFKHKMKRSEVVRW